MSELRTPLMVSIETHREIVQDTRNDAAIVRTQLGETLATNAALAARVTELEAALDAAQDDAARLRAVIEEVEFVQSGGPYWSECAWCRKPYPDHAPDCARQAALAQTGGEVKQ